MSNIEKIGTQVGNTCVGAFAVMLGDPSGGTLAATGLVGFAAIGTALASTSAKRVCRVARKGAIDAIEASPEFRSVNRDRVLALLESDTGQFDRNDLIQATKSAKDFDVDAALAQLVYDALPFDKDDDATKRVLQLALEAGMRACHQDAEFKDGLKSVQLVHLVQGVAAAHAKLDRLLAQSADKARELKLTEKLFISLARRIAADVEDIDQAHNELERAVEIATRKPTTGNLDADVNGIIAEVKRLNEEGQLEDAARALDDALEAELAEEDRRAAGIEALIREGIDQAILMRDVEKAAALVVRQVERETPDPSQRFKALRAAQDEWHVRGRDQGLAFDLEVSVAVAQTCVDRAKHAYDYGTGLNDLGNALYALAERESGTARLKQALSAYHAALAECTRVQMPLVWAGRKNNLGNALYALAERESGKARLEEAVAAYRAALEERTRDRVPLDWAMTQTNLGNALLALGERESGTTRLEEAVAAFRMALEERTRERVPLDWAATQNNLGNALKALDQRESGTAQLEEAVAAYRAALEEWTLERVPLDWARTTSNLGLVYEALFDKTGDQARLMEAVALVQAAREVFEEAGASFYIETSDRILAQMEAKL